MLKNICFFKNISKEWVNSFPDPTRKETRHCIVSSQRWAKNTKEVMRNPWDKDRELFWIDVRAQERLHKRQPCRVQRGYNGKGTVGTKNRPTHTFNNSDLVQVIWKSMAEATLRWGWAWSNGFWKILQLKKISTWSCSFLRGNRAKPYLEFIYLFKWEVIDSLPGPLHVRIHTYTPLSPPE